MLAVLMARTQITLHIEDEGYNAYFVVAGLMDEDELRFLLTFFSPTPRTGRYRGGSVTAIPRYLS
jgi:hypothetical protein